MRKVTVKNGTPVGNEHLCKRCTFGQSVTGYRQSDVVEFIARRPTFRSTSESTASRAGQAA